MRKIVIAMRSDDWGVELEKQLNNEFSVILCFDGITASELLESLSMDILLIDLSLPLLDARSVLKGADSHLPPLVLATTTYDGTKLLDLVQELPIHKIFKLPSDVQQIVESIRTLSQSIPTSPAKTKTAARDISALLTKLGIRSDLSGFQQLTRAILLYAEDPTIPMCKELYPSLTESGRFSNGKAVEHTIRNAIKGAWLCRDEQIWNQYFPTYQNSYPPNKAFISRLAQIISNP